MVFIDHFELHKLNFISLIIKKCCVHQPTQIIFDIGSLAECNERFLHLFQQYVAFICSVIVFIPGFFMTMCRVRNTFLHEIIKSGFHHQITRLSLRPDWHGCTRATKASSIMQTPREDEMRAFKLGHSGERLETASRRVRFH